MAMKLGYSIRLSEFVRRTVALFLVHRYSVRGEHTERIVKMKPPYLVLPNHVSYIPQVKNRLFRTFLFVIYFPRVLNVLNG